MVAETFAPTTWAEPVLRRLRASGLGEDDIDAVAGMLGPPLEHRSGAPLGDDGEGTCLFVISGWAARVRTTPWGGRQVLDVLVPGDQVGFSTRPHPERLYQVMALTRGSTCDAHAVRDLVRRGDPGRPGLAAAAGVLESARITRMYDHVCRLGGGTAYQAIGHLLLELRRRLAEIGMVYECRAPMLLTQEVLAATLGVTSVQVNRVLAQFRREGLVMVGAGWADMPDPERLAEAIGLRRG